MCGYSLHNFKSRPVKVDDKLTTRDFGTGTVGFAALVFVFDDYAHAHIAVHVVGRPEYPDAGIVHLHDHVGALGDVELEHIHARRRRDRIAVKCDHSEAVARQRQRNLHRHWH